MKVYLGSYNRWWHPNQILYPLKCLFRISYDDYYGKYNRDTGEIEGVVPRFNKTKIGKWLRHRSYNTEQRQYVKIDRWDTFDPQYNLALIISPLLIEMRKEKHGVPFTKASDAPEMFSNVDCYDKERWNWILDEMIFAFSAIIDPKRETQFYSGEFDWKFEEVEVNGQKLSQLTRGPNHTFTVDREAQKVYEDRVANGLRLFGVYYQSLWT